MDFLKQIYEEKSSSVDQININNNPRKRLTVWFGFYGISTVVGYLIPIPV